MRAENSGVQKAGTCLTMDFVVGEWEQFGCVKLARFHGTNTCITANFNLPV